MVILIHKFITYLTCLENIKGHFIAIDRIFSIDGSMNCADHLID